MITKAVNALHTAGYQVALPVFPLSPLPVIAVSAPGETVETVGGESDVGEGNSKEDEEVEVGMGRKGAAVGAGVALAAC